LCLPPWRWHWARWSGAFIGTQPFVYVLGRAFLGTACALWPRRWGSGAGIRCPGVGDELSLVARWLMAWGDAFVTGMLTAVFVAFKPQWLATWSRTWP
jgi:hypothetical protein